MLWQDLRSVLEIIIFQIPLSLHGQLLFVNIICFRVIMANRLVTAHVKIARLLFFLFLYYYIYVIISVTTYYYMDGYIGYHLLLYWWVLSRTTMGMVLSRNGINQPSISLSKRQRLYDSNLIKNSLKEI